MKTILFLRTTKNSFAYDRIHPCEVTMLGELSKIFRFIECEADSLSTCNRHMEKLRERGLKIHAVWFKYHGDVDSITLCKGSEMRNFRFDLIEPHGHVVFRSCETGRENANGLNVAEWAKLYAGPDRRVTAPTISTQAGSIIYVDAERGLCDVRYERDPNGSSSYSESSYSPTFEVAQRKFASLSPCL